MEFHVSEDQWSIIDRLLRKEQSSLKSYISRRTQEQQFGDSVTTAAGIDGLKAKRQSLFEVEELIAELSNQY